MILMKYEEWVESIHQNDGISLEREKEFRFEVVTFMTYFGIFLNLSQKTIAKAIHFFHRVSKKISFKKFDRLLYVAVCIFLSSKLDDRPRSLKDSVKAFLYILNIHKKQKSSTSNTQSTISLDSSYETISKEGFQGFYIDSKSLNEHEEKFCNSEFEILKLIGFNLDVELPYVYLDLIKSNPIIPDSTFLKIANNFINDSLRTLVSLYYEPKIIALAALNLAQFYCNHKLLDIEVGKPWYQCFGDEVNMPIIEEVTGHIMELYKKNTSNDNNKMVNN